MNWEIIDTGRQSPQKIMQLDSDLLDDLTHTDRPLLHLYEWDCPCLTYGYFVPISNYVNQIGLKKHSLQTARRPTGGGIILHVTDFAFSILIPSSSPYFSSNTLESYSLVNTLIAQAIASLIPEKIDLCVKDPILYQQNYQFFCMSKPTKFDLIIQGKKMGGAAQRRKKQGILHQGSLSLAFPSTDLLKDLFFSDRTLINQMFKNSFTFLKPNCAQKEIEELRQEIVLLLKRQFQ